uniref:T26-18p n=1 Tax=Thermococcus sp. 26/2 TaxID=758583 RepID=D6MY41_9EURY|nr:t26-18p [Thermococcus sp. 26/2]
MKRFKNLIVIIDRSTEHESRRGFTVLALVGVWDSEVGPLKRIVFRDLNLKHAKKYGSAKKAKMDMLKAALKGERTALADHIYFIGIYRIPITGKLREKDLPQRFYDDFEQLYPDCKFILGDKDVISILKRRYPDLKTIEEKESKTTARQYKHLMLLVDNIAYFARIAYLENDLEFLELLRKGP